MSLLHLDQVYRVKNLTRLQQDILVYLASKANDEGTLKAPSIEALCAAAYVNKEGVMHALEQLAKRGLVTVFLYPGVVEGFRLHLEPEEVF